MNTESTVAKQWTERELDRLPVEDRFRLRGLETTRLDTLVDAAFAFALTLLVISFDDLPSTYAELVTALKRIPAFVASSAILIWFWIRHRRWSRRYGLENSRTIVLSIALVLVILIYVYPIRTLFESLFAFFSSGYLPSTFRVESSEEMRGVTAIFSLGFFAMSLVFVLLYRATLNNSSQLALNQHEFATTKNNTLAWAIASVFSMLSILLALVLPAGWVPVAGFMYFALGLAMSLPERLSRRRAAVK